MKKSTLIASFTTAAALLAFGGNAPDSAAETVPAAPAAETVTASNRAISFDRVAISTTAAPAVTGANTWAASTLAGAGVQLPGNVEIVFSDSGNCGAAISATGQGGCTHTLPGRKVIVLSAGMAWTEPGSHVLFHEAAHALGITDECQAEAFAHQFEEPGRLIWSYPACK